MDKVYCGLYRLEVDNWDEHVKTELQQRYLGNYGYVKEVFDDSRRQALNNITGGNNDNKDQG